MAKILDRNGFATYTDNVVSKEGVFEYRENQVIHGGDFNKIVKVYRPFSELEKGIKTFEQLPVLLGHEMIGKDAKNGYDNTPYDKKGGSGVMFNLRAQDGKAIADIKVFSEKLLKHIDGGGKALSLGYYCKFKPESGIFNGQEYQYVQHDIVGNHIASVERARCGTDVKINDQMDTEDFMIMDEFDLETGETAQDEFIDMRDVKDVINAAGLSAEQKEKIMSSFDKKAYKRNSPDEHKSAKKQTISMPTGKDEDDISKEKDKTKENKMAEKDDTKKVGDESVDKRKLIDEVGGILKGKFDDETIRTVMKKMEQASYNGSEASKANDEDDPKKGEKKGEDEDDKKKPEDDPKKAMDEADIKRIVAESVKSAMDEYAKQNAPKKGITSWIPKAQDEGVKHYSTDEMDALMNKAFGIKN